MAKLNIKQPKYILPLVMLPFIILLGYVFGSFGKDNKQDDMVSKNELNTELQDAREQKTGSKIDALRTAFNRQGDFTGIQNVEKEEGGISDGAESLYETKEMAYIDSINQVTAIKEEEIKKMTERYTSKDYVKDSITKEESQMFFGARQQPNYSSQQDSTPQQKQEALIQKQIERVNRQKAKIDSMRMAATYSEQQAEAKQKQKEKQETEQSITNNGSTGTDNAGTSLVHKANTSSSFNTLSNKEEQYGIVAMLDETVKVRGESRVKIRLLEDVVIDDMTMKSGDYIYGIVTGITGQRVNISIKSVMVKGKICKVNLVVYDNDGMEGFFIPDNYFRTMTKEIASTAVNQTNFTFENATETWQSLIYKTLNNVIRQLTSAIGRTIRQPKATLKYNTQIYLYNNN